MLGNVSFFCCCFFRNTIRLANSLDRDQNGHSVGPDLGPNCLQRLSADDKSLQARKELSPFKLLWIAGKLRKSPPRRSSHNKTNATTLINERHTVPSVPPSPLHRQNHTPPLFADNSAHFHQSPLIDVPRHCPVQLSLA